MAKLISKTYGDALFDLGVESGKLDSFFEQVDMLSKLFADNPDLITLLTHPKITGEEKLSVIENTFKGNIDDEILGFLSLIVEKDRAKDITGIFGYFRQRVYEYKKIGIVYVTSAQAIDENQKKKIENKLLSTTGYKSLEVSYDVDEKLIGGMTIRIGDRVVDSSIKNKLEKMTGELRKVSLAK